MNEEQRLRAFLQERFPGFDESFDAEAELSGIVDSLGLFDVVDFVERDFDVDVPTAEFSPIKFSSIRRILDFVEELRTQ
jgi:acyl carrier protein